MVLGVNFFTSCFDYCFYELFSVISTRIDYEIQLNMLKETALMERHLLLPQGLQYVPKSRILSGSTERNPEKMKKTM